MSVFRVSGERLQLADVVPSGGDFPASIAVFRDLVYVLNRATMDGCKGSRFAAITSARSKARVARSASRMPTRRTT
jgi:hypothetical protein